MAKNVVIAVLLLCVVALSAAVVRLESYHYASFTEMCREFQTGNPLTALKHHECLHDRETRTSALWHVFYGVLGGY